MYEYDIAEDETSAILPFTVNWN